MIERTIALTSGSVIRACDLPKSILRSSGLPPNGSAPSQQTFPPVVGPESTLVDETQSLAHPASVSRDEALRVAEHQYLASLMKMHQGNVSEAARQAGLSRQGLHKLLKSHNLRAEDYR